MPDPSVRRDERKRVLYVKPYSRSLTTNNIASQAINTPATAEFTPYFPHFTTPAQNANLSAQAKA